jgi:hypothetical protein
VAIQPPTTLQPSARVRLADTTVWAATSNDQLIETRLVIAAPELAQCILQLPTEQELVSVRLDEQPAIIQPFEAGRWRVSLGPTPLPQTLEIISLARANEDRQKLQRPLLLVKGQPMPVEFSLWSIGRLAPAGRLRIAGANTVTAAEQAAFRLDRLVGIAEASTPAAVEAPHPDGYHWFRPWADRLSSLREEAAQKMRSVAGRSLSQVSASAEEQLTRASDRLDLWIEQCNELLADRGLKKVPASGADGPVARPRESPPVSQWIYCVAEGGASVLMVDSATVTATPSQIRVVGLLAIFCSAAASVWLMRRPAAADFLYRWPHAITFLFGIVYWAWLWPSWLGILIAGGSLISAWWLGWPGRSLSMERSTVLRVSRSDVVAP